MTINYKKLDRSSKVTQFLEGIFYLESDKNSNWIWSSTKVYGVVSNVDFITIKAFSEIDNVLIFDNNQMEIKPDCLNIIKLNVSKKSEFLFELRNSFKALNDSRELGLRIVGVLVDEEVIF
jgi:hypothetical protein